jgi:hypothetical protein
LGCESFREQLQVLLHLGIKFIVMLLSAQEAAQLRDETA